MKLNPLHVHVRIFGRVYINKCVKCYRGFICFERLVLHVTANYLKETFLVACSYDMYTLSLNTGQ